MLATWFRIKYPSIATGSVASSAPVLYFHGGGIDWGLFHNITAATLVNSGCSRGALTMGFDSLFNLGASAFGRAYLNNIFRLSPLSPIRNVNDVWYLYYFIQEALEYMAMVDYPYASNFLAPMPGYPVTLACSHLASVAIDDISRAEALKQAIDVYYNYTGSDASYCIYGCGDEATAALGSLDGWPWQECTEMVMEMCARGGANDIFFNQCPNANDPNYLRTMFAFCEMFAPRGWNWQMLRENAIAEQYGLNFANASNIIFTNGNLDPWSAAGVYATSPGVASAAANGVYTYRIDGSAHHLDLRTPNSCDPRSVHSARYQIVRIVWYWSFPARDECQNGNYVAWSLPPAGPLTAQENCTYVVNGFPWGISDPVGV